MNIKAIRQKQIMELIKSLITDYSFLLTENDYNFINSISFNNIDDTILEKIADIVKRVWEYDLNSGEYVIISWNKGVVPPDRSLITFATISKRNDIISFCDSDNGIEYSIEYDAILGALPKDGATLPVKHPDEYTIAVIKGQAFSSYNCATKFITPKQLINLKDCNYNYKYNELVLDSSKIKMLAEYRRNSL